jgi:hypothetical protein
MRPHRPVYHRAGLMHGSYVPERRVQRNHETLHRSSPRDVGLSHKCDSPSGGDEFTKGPTSMNSVYTARHSLGGGPTLRRSCGTLNDSLRDPTCPKAISIAASASGRVHRQLLPLLPPSYSFELPLLPSAPREIRTAVPTAAQAASDRLASDDFHDDHFSGLTWLASNDDPVRWQRLLAIASHPAIPAHFVPAVRHEPDCGCDHAMQFFQASMDAGQDSQLVAREIWKGQSHRRPLLKPSVGTAPTPRNGAGHDLPAPNVSGRAKERPVRSSPLGWFRYRL